MPSWSLSADKYEEGIFKRKREEAIKLAHIQPNAYHLKRWMVFDIDNEDSFFSHEENRVHAPNFISVNPQNGHSHYGYLLSDPVSFGPKTRQSSIEFCADVERGMAKRLGADPGYGGLICKNPFHERWVNTWITDTPVSLARLNDYLTKEDKRKPRDAPKSNSKPYINYGISRNCTIFEDLRKVSYKEVLKFKDKDRGFEMFEDYLLSVAIGFNRNFPTMLHDKEVKNIVKSICKWTWKRFSKERFSEIQRKRIQKRWAGVSTLTATKPWESLGISRRTWERRMASSPSTPLHRG